MYARIARVNCVHIAYPRFTYNHCVEVSCFEGCISGYLGKSPLCLIVAPEVICVLKCQIEGICLLGTWREVQVCFRLEQPNVVQQLSSASRYMLFGEYGSVFLTPGGLKNDQKVVVEKYVRGGCVVQYPKLA